MNQARSELSKTGEPTNVKTTVEKLTPTRAKLTISVTPEELKPSITHAYGHIAEQVSIPGFRKGKVPPPIIDQRVGRGAVLEHGPGKGLLGDHDPVNLPAGTFIALRQREYPARRRRQIVAD